MSTQPTPPNDTRREIKAHVLLKSEIYRRDHQKWLEERGYMLRPRFTPGWIPSWTVGGDREWEGYNREDGLSHSVR